MSRLLHVADVHLDAPLGGFGREADARRAETLDAFRALPGTAEEHEVDAVVIAGDLFDRPRPTETTIIAVREAVRRLAEREIPVFAVPGNHDARALNPGLYPGALDGATAFDAPRFGAPARVPLDPGDLLVYGIAYDAAEEPDPLSTFRRAADEDATHVVVLHGSIPGAPHWEGGSSLPLPLDRLAALGADYLALGDLHRFRGPDELDGLPAAYPGSFAAVDFTETGLHGPLLVDLEQGAAPRIRRLGSGVREVADPVRVDVSACADDREVAEAVFRLAGADAYPVATLEGEPAYPLDPDAVQAILEERAGAAMLRDESRFFDPARLAEIARQNTIVGHVARLGLGRIEEASGEERIAIEQGLRIALRVLEVS